MKDNFKNILSEDRPERDWKKEAIWRVENRDWLRISGAITITLLEIYDKETRNKVKELLDCNDKTLDDIMYGKHDFTLSEIHKLISIDGFVNVITEYISWKNDKKQKNAIS